MIEPDVLSVIFSNGAKHFPWYTPFKYTNFSPMQDLNKQSDLVPFKILFFIACHIIIVYFATQVIEILDNFNVVISLFKDFPPRSHFHHLSF